MLFRSPVILTIGKAFTVTDEVVALQLVVVLVKVKVELPAATPVTTPALVTLAEAGVLLTQVPPVVGDKVVVPPLAQIEDVPVILTIGKALLVYVPALVTFPPGVLT